MINECNKGVDIGGKRAANSMLANKIFRLLFALLWVQNCAYLFLYRILVRIPIIRLFSDLIFPAVVVLLIVGAAPFIFKRLRAAEVFVYLGLSVAILLSLVFNTEAVSAAIEGELFRMLVATMPFLFVGASLDYKENEKWLFYLSAANVAAMLGFQVYNILVGNELLSDNMAPSYYVLPSVAYLLLSAVDKKGALRWCAFLIGLALLLSYGTRGPILCIAVFAAGLIIYKAVSIKSLALKAIFIIITVFVIYLLAFTDFFYSVLMWLSELFGGFGLSTRIFDMALENNILDDSGRGGLSEKILAAISENAIFGKGIMADRGLLGNYAHNIAYELWYSFGVILGTAVLGAIIVLPIVAMRRTGDHAQRLFIWMLSVISIVKLLLSSSFLYETNLFLLIGYSLSVIRRNFNNIT